MDLSYPTSRIPVLIHDANVAFSTAAQTWIRRTLLLVVRTRQNWWFTGQVEDRDMNNIQREPHRLFL